MRAAFIAAALFAPPRAHAAAAAAAPAVTITAPAPGAVVAGTVVLAARASSPAGVAGVQFQVDGAALGTRVNAPPFTLDWNTAQAPGDAHQLTATVWDHSGSSATSPAVSVIVDNTPLLITSVSAASATATSAAIAWATNLPSDSQVEYGPTTAYGSTTVLGASLVTAHTVSLSGLADGTA